jgi:hypothetical protein
MVQIALNNISELMTTPITLCKNAVTVKLNTAHGAHWYPIPIALLSAPIIPLQLHKNSIQVNHAAISVLVSPEIALRENAQELPMVKFVPKTQNA